MNRTWIVAKNEFLKRVKSRWFIFTTLLGPVALVALFAVVGYMSVQAMEGGERRVLVLDETGVLFDGIEARGDEQLVFELSDRREEDARQTVLDGLVDGFLVIPASVVEGSEQVTYYTQEAGLGGTFSRQLQGIVSGVVMDYRLDSRNVPADIRDIIGSRLDLDTVKLTQGGEDAGSAELYAVIGFVMGFLLYIAMLVYGSVVMQGVIEEKLSRVVEIIVSSVRPFELLLGKILGIGAMGLLQMVVWAGLIMAGTMFSGALVALFVEPGNFNLPVDASDAELLAAVDFQVPQMGADVFIWFVLFFLVGYLLYASLFAAIGSAVEQQQDAQGLMLPVMLPIILSIVFIQPILESPNSSLAVALSMIPFFSPIPMVVRVAVTDVPFWQVSLSFLLMVGAFLISVWISARIYRIGILMYGKKANLRDLIRWMRYA